MRKEIIIGLCASFCACHSGTEQTKAPVGGMFLNGEEKADPQVEYMLLQPTDFAEEILSAGRLQAATKAEVKWKVSEEIATVCVRNGEFVRKGQVLAVLDSTQVIFGLRQHQDAMAKAKLDLQDMLIGQGYKLEDSARVPQKVLEIAQLRSGYRQTKTAYDQALMNRQKLVLRAPVSGQVANLKAKAHQQAGAGETFCTLIDCSSLEVSFPLMEDEVDFARIGTPVVLERRMNDSLKAEAKVMAVNPTVDANGMVTVTATTHTAPREWLDGMKVNVKVQRLVPGELVVPKQAVVNRDGKAVVFSIKGGRAYWNYVETGRENSTHYTIRKGLQEGDSIIVSGNEQLAHLSPITFFIAR